MNLKQLLQPRLGEELSAHVVRAYDVIGDVAIVTIPAELDDHEGLIAETLLGALPRIRLVGRRAGGHGGEYRLRPLRRIGGRGSFATIHKEFGLRLQLDPSQVYFSPRLAEERFRLASQVGEGERVLVMFSGVAPLPLMIARQSRAMTIFAIEKNPAAHEFARANLEKNQATARVRLFQGDVDVVAGRLDERFDRIAMPYPAGAAPFLPSALGLLKRGGWLHFYSFQQRDAFAEAVAAVERACRRHGRVLRDASTHACGHVGTRRYRVCVDAWID